MFIAERIKEAETSLYHLISFISFITIFIFPFLFPEFLEPFILSAERFGISLFYKELDFTKNRLVEMHFKKSERQGKR